MQGHMTMRHIAAAGTVIAVITATDSGYYGSVAAFGDWRKNISHSELALIPGDSYHISASYPDVCAAKAAEFLARLRA